MYVLLSILTFCFYLCLYLELGVTLCRLKICTNLTSCSLFEVHAGTETNFTLHCSVCQISLLNLESYDTNLLGCSCKSCPGGARESTDDITTAVSTKASIPRSVAICYVYVCAACQQPD